MIFVTVTINILIIQSEIEYAQFIFAGTQKDDPTKLHTVMQFPNMEALQAFRDDKELTEKRKEAGAVIESAVMIPISDEHLTNYPDAYKNH